MLVNTQYFREVAIRGTTKAPPGTYEYTEWWGEQRRRCKEGYRVGDIWIPGRYYFYLNFCPILHKEKRRTDFPNFLSMDLDYYLAVEEAIQQCKNLIVIKGRQLGFSWKAGSLAAHNFLFNKESSTLLACYGETYANSLWDKFNKVRSQHSGKPFGKLLTTDNAEEKRSGYIDSATKEVKGFKSTAYKRIYRNNASASIGLTVDLILFDEIGKWPNLKESVGYTIDLIKHGESQSGTMILFGSAGDMERGGSLAAQEIFYYPEKYNCVAFDNVWENSDRKIGYFVPKTKYYPPYVDQDGNPDEETATKAILKRRGELDTGDTTSYNLEVIQNPLVPSDAFLLSVGNIFDQIKLNEQMKRINNSKELSGRVVWGDLVWVNDAVGGDRKVEFVPGSPKFNKDGDPIHNVFQILERPEESLVGQKDVYVSGCDSFDAEVVNESVKMSLGSMFVYKMFTDMEHTGQMFVGQVTCRPKDPNIFYEMVAKMCVYYKCQVLIEHSNLGIINWFIQNGYSHYLKTAPPVVYKDIQSSRLNYKYGLQMTDPVKTLCLSKLKNYVDKFYDRILFLDLIRDLLMFTRETNHDRTIAAMLAIIHEADIAYRKMATVEKKEFRMPYMTTGKNNIIKSVV